MVHSQDPNILEWLRDIPRGRVSRNGTLTCCCYAATDTLAVQTEQPLQTPADPGCVDFCPHLTPDRLEPDLYHQHRLHVFYKAQDMDPSKRPAEPCVEPNKRTKHTTSSIPSTERQSSPLTTAPGPPDSSSTAGETVEYAMEDLDQTPRPRQSTRPQSWGSPRRSEVSQRSGLSRSSATGSKKEIQTLVELSNHIKPLEVDKYGEYKSTELDRLKEKIVLVQGNGPVELSLWVRFYLGICLDQCTNTQRFRKSTIESTKGKINP